MNNQQGHIERDLRANKQLAREFAKERLVLDATERIREIMERQGVSQAELSKRWGTSKAYVSQVLTGNRNMTLRTLADIMFLLDRAVEISDVDFVSSISCTNWAFSYPAEWKSEPSFEYRSPTTSSVRTSGTPVVLDFDAA
jgi:transcriptional regulator with XRE-family HTH domain